MPKLHLKRTPEEEAAHQARKRQRKETKRKRKGAHRTSLHKETAAQDGVKWASSDEEPEYGPQPSSSKTQAEDPHSKLDYDAIRAELEDRRFREKMFDALGDDERLDSVETQLNDYAHVPDRWRHGNSGKRAHGPSHYADEDAFLKTDPRYMDDEEYAEWIRVGMYRRTHAEEYAEQQRKDAARAAKRAQEKARKVETAKLEKLAEEERKLKKRRREARKQERAKLEYERRWRDLYNHDGSGEQQILGFLDIPWPIITAFPDRTHAGERHAPITLDELTAENISSFILPLPASSTFADEKERKERKERLRETILRYHPDKFEGRLMSRIIESEKGRVREAIGQVVRALNTLMAGE